MIETAFAIACALIPAAIWAPAVARGVPENALVWGYAASCAVLLSGMLWLIAAFIKGWGWAPPAIVILSGTMACLASAKKLSKKDFLP